tara:strand:- start:521 stop:1006 length:486 start_codon:yes stop_codon:yes gene_type:complete
MGFDLEGERQGYFRNNVWFWRPLCDYVLTNCDGVGTPEEQRSWHYNDGHFVPSEVAKSIANQLEALVLSGKVKTHAEQLEKRRIAAEQHNEGVRKRLEALGKEVDALGVPNLTPGAYPQPYRDRWEYLYSLMDHDADYPFSVENVNTFIDFCRKSGGFTIN